jgi:negative regulator of flagellin synthesis FlgM
MAIDPLTGRQLVTVQTKASPKGSVENKSDKPTVETGSSDSVSIRANTVGLTASEALNNRTPPVDENKVNMIRQSIADGSYRVDAEKLAQKIIQFEAAFGQDST